MLRTCFVATGNGRAAAQQVVLPADAVSLEVAVVTTNGKPLLQLDTDGNYNIADGTSLAAEWHTFRSAPFDLFSDSLARFKVPSGSTVAAGMHVVHSFSLVLHSVQAAAPTTCRIAVGD